MYHMLQIIFKETGRPTPGVINHLIRYTKSARLELWMNTTDGVHSNYLFYPGSLQRP